MRNRSWMWLALLCGCGRSMVFDCHVTATPAALDFGTAAPGAAVTRAVTLTMTGNEGCDISGLAIEQAGAQGFSLAAAQATELAVPTGQSATVSVVFAPVSDAPSLSRSGTLVFQADDFNQPSVSIPLTGLLPQCTLKVTPQKLAFGEVSLGVPSTQQVTLDNAGTLDCDVTGVALSAGSDPGFTLPSQPTSFTLAPGGSAELSVAFEAAISAPPAQRAGTLTFQTGDPKQPTAAVALTAEVPKCTLAVTPAALGFGNVPLNGTRSEAVTLSNDGGVTCEVSAVALSPDTDGDFSIPASQPTSFSVAPGGSATLTVGFDDLGGATPPLAHQGTLTFLTGDYSSPDAGVPLSAFVNTSCTVGGQWIYTVDTQDNMLSSFHPDTLTFKDIGTIDCPTRDQPNSMAVDQEGVAWVNFNGGELFQVSTLTAACQATSFQIDQQGFNTFGMGFCFQPATDTDTLFVASGEGAFTQPANLGSIAFPSLALTLVAPLTISSPELTGTGDGELWAFSPFAIPPVIDQIDTTSGAVLTSLSLDAVPSITGGGDWAMAFYGGAFYVFLAADTNSTTVYQVQRDTGVVATVLPDTGRHVVGAGVSTCAPLQ